MISSGYRGVREDRFISVLLGLGAFGLYVKTLAPGLLMADPAEFQLACYTLGLAHPTGYPLYLALGWLWSHLLAMGNPAFRINLLSTVFAASAVAFFYPLVLEVVGRSFPDAHRAFARPVAVIAAVMLAVSPAFWSQALVAEVYALNSLFVVCTLRLVLSWASSGSSRMLGLTAFVYGLSLTHHVTMLLLLPALLAFVWLRDRSVFRSWKLVGSLLLLSVLPLSLYLYIPWRAPVTPYLHINLAPGRTLELYNNTLRGFLGFVTGETFAAELGYQAPLVERLGMAAQQLLRQFGFVGVGLALVGVIRQASGGARPRRILALLGLCYVGVVGFTLFYNIGDVHVLYTPSFIVFSLWVALGMIWVLEFARARLSGLSPLLIRSAIWGLVGLLALLPASSLWRNYAGVDKSGDYQAREWAQSILDQPIPQGAILVSNDRNEITPLLYLQYVEGVRPDLLSMFPLMLPGEEYSNVVRVIDGVLNVGRPLILIKSMPGLEIKYQLEPVGTLVEVTGPASSGPPEHHTDLTLAGKLTLIGYGLEPEHPSPGEELLVSLFWRAEQGLGKDYHTYVHLLDEHGQVVAQSDHRPGEDYYPSSLWQPGEAILDVHHLALPVDAEAPKLSIVAGAYEYPSLAPLGSVLSVGELRMER
jgi:hypothetical protein